MRRIASLISMLFVIGLAPGAQAVDLDLTKHNIETIEIPIPPRLQELHGWMKEFRLFDNVLHFEGLDSEIHVARSTSMRRLADRELESAGFDPETLKLQWLDPGTLILLTWGTVPQGQGRYSKEGNLILLFEGRHLQELFRDSMYAYGRSGVLDSSEFHFTIGYDRSSALLTLVRTDVERDSSDKKGPLDDEEWTTDSGRTIYYGERRTRTVWICRIEKGHLRFVSGKWFADLQKEHRVPAVAEAFRVPVAKLVQLNPNLKGVESTSGTVCLDDRVAPYLPQVDDGICGDEPCPRE